MTPPIGRERLFAVWCRTALATPPEMLRGPVENGDLAASQSYRATRDMKRLKESIRQLRPEDWHAIIMKLDHRAGP